jgi:hypothetical protein
MDGRSIGGDDLVAGSAFEFGHQLLIGRGQPPRDHHPDLGGDCATGQQQDAGEAEHERAKADRNRFHEYFSLMNGSCTGHP